APLLGSALQTMVLAARSRGVSVLLGTLLPQRVGACRGYAPGSIVPANNQIRTVAANTGATLVDLYQAFGGSADLYIGGDGLHPSSAGYQKMADTFFNAIRSRFEVPTSTTTMTRAPR